MATKDQNATTHRGAALEIRVAVTDAAGEPLPLAGLPLYYRVAARALSASSLLTISGADISVLDNVATITIKREQSLTLPVAELYHELYTADGSEAAHDDAVLMTGSLNVLAAQIAQHPAAGQ